MNAGLADISDLAETGLEPPQYFLISTETDQERRRVERSIRPTVAALVVLGVAAAAFTVALASLAAASEHRRTQPEQRQSRSYGWPWDLAATTGSGYGDLDLDAAEGMFEDDPDVATWTALELLNEVSLDGEPMMTVVGLDRTSDLDLPVLAGALPRADDEVAVGATVASARGLAVGDTVELGGVVDPPRQATVTGLVVFPTLGPFETERIGTGTGLLLAETAFDSLSGPYGKADVRDLATFIGVDLHDAADTPATRTRVREQLGGLDLLANEVLDHATPVRPPEIIDARSTRTVPVAVATVFAAVTAIGLVFASWASVRSRRREHAVLRALGFSGSQLRRSVYLQSIATMLGALAIGVPIGVIAGRVMWRAYADQLGVIPDPATPWAAVSLAAAGGVALAAVAALVPAHIAARSAPADGLRSE